MLDAWRNLSSERPVGFSTGDIPWSAKVRYANYHKLPRDLTDALIFLTSRMDTAYREWHDKNPPKGDS